MVGRFRWVAPRRAVRRLRGRLVADLRRHAVAADGAAADGAANELSGGDQTVNLD